MTLGCDAVLFDLDGVLVDSTAVVVRTWQRWALKKGLDPESILEVAHGRRTAETIRLVAPGLDAAAEARELERAETDDLDGIREVAGAKDLLASLPEDRWTVVTSGTRPLATRRLKHLGLPVPKSFVTAEDVENGKPHPEPYLLGADILGVRPENCVVIEDAPSGIRAASAAGMSVVALTTTYRREDLYGADAVVESLYGLRVVPAPGLDGGTRLRLLVD